MPHDRQRRLARAEAAYPGTRTPSSIEAYELPPDLLRKAVRRVGFLGLVCGITAPGAFLAELYLQPARVVLPGLVPFPFVAALCLFLLGLGMYLVSNSRKIRPALIVDLGLIFEVLGALGISLSEHAVPWPPDMPIRGISWVTLWITIFVIAVPGTYGKIVLGAIASACMSPVALFITAAVNRTSLPPPGQVAILTLPNFLAAAWAIPVARYIHRLGAHVGRARELGSYELVELIGKGAMGEVWRARHRMLARDAAIKLISADALAFRGGERLHMLVQRFEREARAIAALRSPHTISLYDFGISDDGRLYYVMELLDGIDLEYLVRHFGPQPPSRTVYFLRQVCKSLAEAHDAGLVHRDVKPKNLFTCRFGVEYDFLKVLDFGLVKHKPWNGETESLTVEGITGTPAYLAPEMASGGRELDGRADIYALGCVAYWLLTGHLVFERDTIMATVLDHVHTPPIPPSRRAGMEVPADLERLILECLEKDPRRRPQNARDLAAALGECDLPPWTPHDAEAWWRTRLPHLTAATFVQGPATTTRTV